MAYKFQFGPSVMSGTLEQEGSVDVTSAGVLKIAGSNLSDASRNVTAATLSASGDLNIADNATVNGTARIYGAITADSGLNGPVGAVTPNAGKFTTVSGSGQLDIVGAANIYGAVVTPGGITSNAASNTFGATSFSDANITNVGSIALDTISADGASFAFGSNWTAAGRTCADAGILTTVDINGGTVDGTSIGTSVQSYGKFTTISGSGNGNYLYATQIKGTLQVSGAMTAAALITANAGLAGTTLSASSTLDVVGISRYHGLATFNAGVGSTTLSASSTLDVVGNATTHGTVKFLGVADTALAVAADSFYYFDATDSLVKRDSMADYATAIAGSGLSATAGVLAVEMSELSAVAIDNGADALVYIDSADGATKKSTMTQMATFAVGTVTTTGLASTSGVLNLDITNLTGDATPLAADELVFYDAASSGLKNTLVSDMATAAPKTVAEAAMTVADDYITFLDGGSTGDCKKEKWADLVALIAGSGLTATNGVLSSDSAGTPQGIGNANGTLTEGMNYGTTTFTADRTWTLPAAPTIGDVVHVKAPASLGAFELIVLKGSADHRIDTAESVSLESNWSAISLMYVASDLWSIF
jgi:hypothetical protein